MFDQKREREEGERKMIKRLRLLRKTVNTILLVKLIIHARTLKKKKN